MRLRYFLLLAIFVLICIFLPHLVESAYNTNNPIIIWSYTQSDILNYSAAVLGVIIALVALFLVIDENSIKIRFDISSTVDDENDLCFIFRVINESKVYVKVEQFGFSQLYNPIKMKIFCRTFLFRRLRGQQRMHLPIEPPFELQPNECYDIQLKYRRVKSEIEQLYPKDEKIVLFVSFVTWKHYYKHANEIRQLLKNNYSDMEDSHS
jgi:hypothetical protein